MMERIRITSGDYTERYIGLPVGSGWGTNPVAQNNPPVDVPGSRYGLVVQERAATEFSAGNVGAVQTDLKALGYDRSWLRLSKPGFGRPKHVHPLAPLERQVIVPPNVRFQDYVPSRIRSRTGVWFKSQVAETALRFWVLIRAYIAARFQLDFAQWIWSSRSGA